MKRNLLDAEFAMSLPHDEAVKPESSMYWTGWKRRHWPADVIHPGVRFYIFDLDTRRFCALLEAKKGGSFTYRTRKEFSEQVMKLTGWTPNHDVPHWSRIPFGERGKLYTGFAVRWKVIKQTNIRWDDLRFPQIGWLRLGSEDNISDELDKFKLENKHLSKTVRKRLVDSRLGQGYFREGVLSYWKGCGVTGCKPPSLLKASHIKPWRKCNNAERLDTFNGLALIPNLDVAFDRGLISFRDNGRLLVSPCLDKETLTTLGIKSNMRTIKSFDRRHKQYLKYHREEVFQA